MQNAAGLSHVSIRRARGARDAETPATSDEQRRRQENPLPRLPFVVRRCSCCCYHSPLFFAASPAAADEQILFCNPFLSSFFPAARHAACLACISSLLSLPSLLSPHPPFMSVCVFFSVFAAHTLRYTERPSERERATVKVNAATTAEHE